MIKLPMQNPYKLLCRNESKTLARKYGAQACGHQGILFSENTRLNFMNNYKRGNYSNHKKERSREEKTCRKLKNVRKGIVIELCTDKSVVKKEHNNQRPPDEESSDGLTKSSLMKKAKVIKFS